MCALPILLQLECLCSSQINPLIADILLRTQWSAKISQAACSIGCPAEHYIAEAWARCQREEPRKVDIPRGAPVAGEDIAPVLDPVDLLPAEAGLVGTIEEFAAIEIGRAHV